MKQKLCLICVFVFLFSVPNYFYGQRATALNQMSLQDLQRLQTDVSSATSDGFVYDTNRRRRTNTSLSGRTTSLQFQVQFLGEVRAQIRRVRARGEGASAERARERQRQEEAQEQQRSAQNLDDLDHQMIEPIQGAINSIIGTSRTMQSASNTAANDPDNLEEARNNARRSATARSTVIRHLTSARGKISNIERSLSSLCRDVTNNAINSDQLRERLTQVNEEEETLKTDITAAENVEKQHGHIYYLDRENSNRAFNRLYRRALGWSAQDTIFPCVSARRERQASSSQ